MNKKSEDILCGAFYLVAFFIIAFVASMLQGCAAVPGLYGSASLGAQIDEQTDQLLRTDRPDQCSRNIKFHAEAGYEFTKYWSMNLHHQSWLLCGRPFGNGKPEMYSYDFRITGRIGGR